MSYTLSLNPQQQQAVLHKEGPLLVLAGAGSGKTRVVTHRIAHLIESGVSPSEILAVTFTNKAAEEMRSRIRSMKNVQVAAYTFHSLGARILRESIGLLGYPRDFVIYDEEDSLKLLKTCAASLGLSEDKSDLRQAKQEISRAKNELQKEGSSRQSRGFSSLYPLYQQKLQECGALDFDDLLCLTVRLLKEHPEARAMYQSRWRFLLIDEYQDTNFAQYTLAKLLLGPEQNLFAVGDPDQSIYSWRGARPQNILQFEDDFPGARVVTLDQNYRSTNHILQAANGLIVQNGRKFAKALWSELGEGNKVAICSTASERQEAEYVAKRIVFFTKTEGLSLDKMAIFYRTNAQSRSLEDALLSYKIPYQIIGGLSFYERREIKDLLAYLRMLLSDTDLISFFRTINLPKRGLGPSAIEKLERAAEEQGLSMFALCRRLASDPRGIEGFSLTPKQKKGIAAYVSLILDLREDLASSSVSAILERLVERSGYLAFLEEEQETAQERKENISELIAKAMEREEEEEEFSLTQFLEELSLRTQEERGGEEEASLKLMTLHNSKGLEFDTVFLVGLEEDLLPHINSRDDEAALEEERRLCYVGMTRAKRRLTLTHAVYRFVWGVSRAMRPSRFLRELPKENIFRTSG